MTMLVDFYGLKRKRDLISYTLGGTKFSEGEIVEQYVQLLGRIQSGKLKVGQPQAIIDSILRRSPHVFRKGKLSAAGKRAHDKIKAEMEQLIQSCQEDAAKLRSKISDEGETTGDPNDPNMLLGKSVLVNGSYWGENGTWYNGVVESYGPKRRGQKRKFYHCKWSDGKIDHWKGNDLIKHVVDASFTAASINDGAEIERSDAVFKVHYGLGAFMIGGRIICIPD